MRKDVLVAEGETYHLPKGEYGNVVVHGTLTGDDYSEIEQLITYTGARITLAYFGEATHITRPPVIDP